MFEIHDSLQDVLGATATRELLVKRASESLDSLLQDSDKDSGLLKDVSISYRKIGDFLAAQPIKEIQIFPTELTQWFTIAKHLKFKKPYSKQILRISSFCKNMLLTLLL